MMRSTVAATTQTPQITRLIMISGPCKRNDVMNLQLTRATTYNAPIPVTCENLLSDARPTPRPVDAPAYPAGHYLSVRVENDLVKSCQCGD